MSDSNSFLGDFLPVDANAGAGEAAINTTVSDDAIGSAIEEKAVEENVVEASAEESPATEPATEEPKVDEYASKFAALSRKEKSIRAKELELENRLAELESRQQEIEEYKSSNVSFQERLKNSPIEAMEEAGLTYEDLTRMILENDGKPTAQMEVERLRKDVENKYAKQIEDLKVELADKEKSKEEAHHKEVIEDYIYELNEYIVENSENYELIKANNATDLVFQVIEQHYNDNGKVLSKEEACESVENYLLEEAKKHLKLNKIKSLLENNEPAEKPVEQKRQTQTTLSNTEAAQVPSKGQQVLSDEESKQEVAKLIRWES